MWTPITVPTQKNKKKQSMKRKQLMSIEIHDSTTLKLDVL